MISHVDDAGQWYPGYATLMFISASWGSSSHIPVLQKLDK